MKLPTTYEQLGPIGQHFADNYAGRNAKRDWRGDLHFLNVVSEKYFEQEYILCAIKENEIPLLLNNKVFFIDHLIPTKMGLGFHVFGYYFDDDAKIVRTEIATIKAISCDYTVMYLVKDRILERITRPKICVEYPNFYELLNFRSVPYHTIRISRGKDHLRYTKGDTATYGHGRKAEFNSHQRAPVVFTDLWEKKL